MLALRQQNYEDQAKLESDRGDYFNAIDNLNKALDVAIKLMINLVKALFIQKLPKLNFL